MSIKANPNPWFGLVDETHKADHSSRVGLDKDLTDGREECACGTYGFAVCKNSPDMAPRACAVGHPLCGRSKSGCYVS